MAAMVRFVVPWRPDGGQRSALWEFCRSWWATELPEAELVESPSPDGPFNRSAAINSALRGAWDVAVVLDADIVVKAEQIHEAIATASSSGRVTLGFTEYIGLDQTMTHRVLDGHAGDWEPGARLHRSNHESSAVCIPRAVWDAVGGFDERFVGWGQEDVAFIQAARVLAGEIQRVPGRVWHLYHDRSPERARTPAYQANQLLGRRYRRIRTPAVMHALLDERRPVDPRATAFTRIWNTNAWNGTETKAGPGSSVEATRWLAESLEDIMAELGVSSLLDAGCSDSLWMPEVPGYVGVDIVAEAVAAAQARHPGRDYRVADICTDDLPSCEAIICRDTLQHLSLLDGLTAIANFRRTGAKWLLANTHRGGVNADISSGGWFEIDLEVAPFWLGSPARTWPDGAWAGENRYPNKVFGAWEL